MIYLEEKKYFSVILIIVACVTLATIFLMNKPQILLFVFVAGFIITGFFGAFFIRKVYKKAINNFPVEQILRANVVRNLGQDDLNTIIGNMERLQSDNRYYEGVKRLKLTK